MQAGTYHLKYLSGKTNVFCVIEVIKGVVWGSSDEFILKDDCLIERLNSSMIARISGVKIDQIAEDDEASHLVRVNVDQCSKDAHMVLLGTNFIAKEVSKFSEM